MSKQESKSASPPPTPPSSSPATQGPPAPQYVEPGQHGAIVDEPTENVDATELGDLTRTEIGKYISMLITVNGNMCDSRLCERESRCGTCKTKNKDCWRLWGDENNYIMPGWEKKDQSIYVSCGACYRSGHPGDCSFSKNFANENGRRDDIPEPVYSDEESDNFED